MRPEKHSIQHWNRSMIKVYGAVRLADIEASQPAEWNISGATHVRVMLPASSASELNMQERGFFWADRTLKVSISLARCPVDLTKAVRLPVEKIDGHKKDLLRIACASFPYDRRFHVLPTCDDAVASMVLKEWVDSLDDVLACFFHEKIVGFLALVRNSEESLFVHLAAVEEKYRMAGAAMSLYARACQVTAERGFRRLEGRISSQNTAVMNLYAAFGAIFSEPIDIFLKEVSHDA